MSSFPNSAHRHLLNPENYRPVKKEVCIHIDADVPVHGRTATDPSEKA